MSSSSNPTPDPRRQEGISLEELAEAFATVMGASPRTKPNGEPGETITPETLPATESSASDEISVAESELAAAEITAEPPAEEESCPVSPRSIFEAMLFVGNRGNQPLSAVKAAELMRDVSPEEIPSLVEQLNRHYDETRCPYHIVGEGEGYRLILRNNYFSLRDKFYGRVREARLSQAAIDVLAIVAYQQPLSSEQVNRLRGKSSNHILAQLVRRGLLRIERPDAQPRQPHYCTTDRFLQLFNLQSIEELPRSEEPE
jgi:segregation and condensation protein B